MKWELFNTSKCCNSLQFLLSIYLKMPIINSLILVISCSIYRCQGLLHILIIPVMLYDVWIFNKINTSREIHRFHMSNDWQLKAVKQSQIDVTSCTLLNDRKTIVGKKVGNFGFTSEVSYQQVDVNVRVQRPSRNVSRCGCTIC